jgi:hypothetical protein
MPSEAFGSDTHLVLATCSDPNRTDPSQHHPKRYRKQHDMTIPVSLKTEGTGLAARICRALLTGIRRVKEATGAQIKAHRMSKDRRGSM